MTKPQTLPPDITVTRADVLALPNATAYKSPPMPEEGRSWHIERNSQGLAWVDLPAGMPFSQRAMWEDVHKIETARHLTEQEAAIAERAFLWQTALASDAALADISNDPAPSTPPAPTSPVLNQSDAALWAFVKSKPTVQHLTPAQREEVKALVAESQKMRDTLLDTALHDAVRRVTCGAAA